MGYDYAATTDAQMAAQAGLFGAAIGTYVLICLVVGVIGIIACWKIFTKAGEPGWASIVPFYSQYILFKIAWGNGLLFLLMFVPVVNAVISVMVLYKLCKSFGQGVGFFLGMLFLSPIFIMILAFGSAEYLGPAE